MSENAIIVNQVIKKFGKAKHNNWIKNLFNKTGSNGHKGSTAQSNLAAVLLMGGLLTPTGLWVFNLAERYAKRTGKLVCSG